jgi:superfamily I DNA and/or RNA helicase
MDAVEQLRKLLRLEQNEQEARWNGQTSDWKSLRKEGVAIFPLHVNKRKFGFAEYPLIEVSFHQHHIHSNFRNGTAIALFSESGDAVAGVLQSIDERRAELLLYTHDFPDFLDDQQVGFRLSPDTKTFDLMHGVLKRIHSATADGGEKNEHTRLTTLFEYIHAIKTPPTQEQSRVEEWKNKQLNPSQQEAIQTILGENPISIVHGPPGTGKTTTLVEAIGQLIQRDKKVIASAPSNAAVDHLARELLAAGVHILRLGNSVKTSDEILPYTPEGILSRPENHKILKKLRQRADEMRKMAGQYKRKFGKEEREQRQLLYKEVKSIRNEIRAMSDLFISRAITNETVILGTPVGLRDPLIQSFEPDYFVLDEAGQCLEPLAWVGMGLAQHMVLAGDPYQLPPTVISQAASEGGLSISILEKAFQSALPSNLLNTQYRMPKVLIDFSSAQFYNGELQSFQQESTVEQPLIFIDAAGYDSQEIQDEDGGISNPAELDVIEQFLAQLTPGSDMALISPYSAQVQLAKSRFPQLRCSTIDSFQGQEYAIILLSLVRNNPEQNIGFLKDYRRMNVALTRAKQQLVVVGDSFTLSSDPFYVAFLEHVEQFGTYQSVFEYLY